MHQRETYRPVDHISLAVHHSRLGARVYHPQYPYIIYYVYENTPRIRATTQTLKSIESVKDTLYSV